MSAFVARRPQDFFDVPVDNSNAPFLPPPPVTHADPRSYVPSPGAHPLREELDDLTYSDDVTTAPASPIAPAPTDATPCVFVDTPEALEDMVAHLDKSNEMAVDLEHHSYRSFQGFTCVIQVSTRQMDFVVDALELRGLIRDALGPVMADPRKMKVFHGADMDVQWLQRDFGIYVVGMFDTGQAARVLELPSKGLAYLLDHYCSVKADKRFQLADWRIRPLSEEMISYARGDTHHLLYVYDRLRQQLDAVGRGDGSKPFRDLIRTTLDRSRDVCATLYEKPVTHPLTYHADYRKNRDAGDLDLPRLAVYAALHGWRDERCRAEDESIGYVMPRALMLRLAREAPTNPRALLAVTRGDSPLVAKHSGELVDIISRALAAGEPPAMPPTAGEEWARAEEERKNRTEEKKEKEKKEEEEEEEGVREETRANAPVPAAEIGARVGAASVTTSVTTSAMAAMMGTTIAAANQSRLPSLPPPPSPPARCPEAPWPACSRHPRHPRHHHRRRRDDDDDDAKALRAASRVAEKLPRRAGAARRALPPLAPRQGRRQRRGRTGPDERYQTRRRRARVGAAQEQGGGGARRRRRDRGRRRRRGDQDPRSEGGGRRRRKDQNKGRCAGDASRGVHRARPASQGRRRPRYEARGAAGGG